MFKKIVSNNIFIFIGSVLIFSVIGTFLAHLTFDFIKQYFTFTLMFSLIYFIYYVTLLLIFEYNFYNHNYHQSFDVLNHQDIDEEYRVMLMYLKDHKKFMKNELVLNIEIYNYFTGGSKINVDLKYKNILDFYFTFKKSYKKITTDDIYKQLLITKSITVNDLPKNKKHILKNVRNTKMKNIL